jgi:hypothetical protein
LTVGVFNSKKGNKNVITLEIEFNETCNLTFSKIERVGVCMGLGNIQSLNDIEVIKKGLNENTIDVDQNNNMLVWSVFNLHSE